MSIDLTEEQRADLDRALSVDIDEYVDPPGELFPIFPEPLPPSVPPFNNDALEAVTGRRVHENFEEMARHLAPSSVDDRMESSVATTNTMAMSVSTTPTSIAGNSEESSTAGSISNQREPPGVGMREERYVCWSQSHG